jgi:hypothetical protein
VSVGFMRHLQLSQAFLWLNLSLSRQQPIYRLAKFPADGHSTRNRRDDPDPHLPRALAGIFSPTLVSIKLLLEASLGIFDAHQCAQGNLECLTANRADSDRGGAPEMFY